MTNEFEEELLDVLRKLVSSPGARVSGFEALALALAGEGLHGPVGPNIRALSKSVDTHGALVAKAINNLADSQRELAHEVSQLIAKI